MSQPFIQLASAPIGQGRERTCYLHPEDDSKIIKISEGDHDQQSRREIEFYRRLKKRHDFPYTHIPRFYGQVTTNLGNGIVVDLIRDHDGEISASMHHYLSEGVPIKDFKAALEILRQYVLQHRVIFNHDLVPGNLLLQKQSEISSRLVIIDGLGDVVAIQWLNGFSSHARAKINRRWNRFQQRLDRSWGATG